ncbi:MAG: Na/Pi cotransporter family protein [Chlamydiota bacterium]|nr:Na/Pi cotransporter family protein [Chlamydiota bacterium]
MNHVEPLINLNLASILITLFGGLAIFLFGLEQMTVALKVAGGSKLKKMIARLTTNRFKAAFTGAFVTAIIQSSTATTVLVVGFISAGIMSLSQSIGIIIGAHVGTTFTVQILAFDVSRYALLIVSIGFMIHFFFRSTKFHPYGTIMMGFGFIFFGMQLMSTATIPLQSYPPFIDLLQRIKAPLIGILISTIFTALIHSSAATIGIVIVLASGGLISLETGIALVFGANIGTCVTALLAAINKTREALRAAFIHVLFNVLGVVLWFSFIDQLALAVRWISPSTPYLSGIEKLAIETPRQIANAHTLFNLINTMIFIWFTVPIAWLTEHIIPIRPKLPEPKLLKSLDKILFKTPDLAFDIVRKEMGHMGHTAAKMVRESLKILIQGTKEDFDHLVILDDTIDDLHKDIVAYLGRLSIENLTQAQSQVLYDFMSAANYIENIGDIVQTNMVETGTDRLMKKLQISISTQDLMKIFHEKICWSVESAVEALVTYNRTLAEEVVKSKKHIFQHASHVSHHLLHRLSSEESHRLDVFRVESEILEYYKRIYTLSKQIAKLIVDVDLLYTNGQPEHT